MRIVSGAQYPKGAVKLDDETAIPDTYSNKPHQSIFYEEGNLKTPDELLQEHKPQLSSMNLSKKLFNNRL